MPSTIRTLSLMAAMIAAAFAGAAMAQAPQWAVGTWKGTLEQYRNDPAGPDRVLVVTPDGKCRWGTGGASDAPSAQSCTFTADSINLLTTVASTVQLQNRGGKLQGTFTTRSNRTYHLTMTK